MKKPPANPEGRKPSVTDLPDSLWFDGRASLRLDECARALRVSEQHLLNLIKAGAFPSIDGDEFKKLPPEKRRIPIPAWHAFLTSRYTSSREREAAT